MKLKAILLVCTVTLTVQTSLGHPSPDSNLTPNLEDLDTESSIETDSYDYEDWPVSKCGGILNSRQRLLMYKPLEQIVDNERCVWIISVPRAVGYSVNIVSLGAPTNQPESGQELLLTGIKFINGTNPVLTSFKPTLFESVNVEDSNVLLVTFISSSVERAWHGFTIKYEAVIGGEDETVVSSRSTHHIFEPTTFEFKYPVEGENYDNNELAVFVFLPQGNIKTHSKGITWIKVDEIEGSPFGCVDRINGYKLNPAAKSIDEKWKWFYRRCLYKYGEVKHDDVVLYIFTSDDTTVGSGFSFQYAHSDCSV